MKIDDPMYVRLGPGRAYHVIEHGFAGHVALWCGRFMHFSDNAQWVAAIPGEAGYPGRICGGCLRKIEQARRRSASKPVWPNDGHTQCDECQRPVDEPVMRLRPDYCHLPHYGRCAYFKQKLEG
jgi:hypothetical protein